MVNSRRATVPATRTRQPAWARAPHPPSQLPLPARALVVVAAGLLLLLTAAAPAYAHAELVATTPAAGAALTQAPQAVTLSFSEAVEVTGDGLRVLGPDGGRVDTGHTEAVPDRPGALTVPLKSGVPNGTYVVSWRAVSADSHPVHGAFTFTVGRTDGAGANRAPDLPAGADRDSDPLLTATVSVARGVGYAGLALLIGAIGMLLLIPDGAGRAMLRRLAVNGGLVVIASACAGLLAQGPYAAGAGPGSLLDPALLRPALTGRPGLTTAARTLLTGLLLVAVSRNLPRPLTSWRSVPRRALPVTAALAAVAVTYAEAGHAATGRQVPLGLTADVLHLLAMGLWLGGLVALIRLFAGRARPESLAVATRRFSTAAGWCVAILVVTGVIQAQRRLGAPGQLLTSDYGRLLVAKVLTVLLLLTTARLARRWTRTHATGENPRPAAPALRAMRRTLAVETAIGAVVLTLSTLLAGSAPPHEADTPATAPSSVPTSVRRSAGYDTGSPDGRGTVSARVARRADGGAQVDLLLTDTAGGPVRAEEVTAAWSLPALGLGPLTTELHAAGPGHWSGVVRLSPPGDWRLAVTVRTTDTDEATVAFEHMGTAAAAP